MQKLTADIRKLNNELDELGESNKKFNAKIAEFQKESKLNHEKLNIKEQEIMGLNQTLKSKAVQINENEENIKKLKREIADAMSKNSSDSDDRRNMAAKLDKLNKNLEENNQKLILEVQSHTDLKIKYEAMQKKISSIRSELESMQEQYEIILSENESLTKQLIETKELREADKKKYESHKKLMEKQSEQEREQREALQKQFEEEKRLNDLEREKDAKQAAKPPKSTRKVNYNELIFYSNTK